MPEGDTIFRAARTLQLALGGSLVTGFQTILPHLARVDHDAPITGRMVEAVEPQGKWLVMRFSGDLVLLTHMLMSGSWHIYRPGERWQRPHRDMRIVIQSERIIAVAFLVPVAEFHTSASLSERLAALGPSVLGSSFDEAAAVARLESTPGQTVADALLAQSRMAGIGNVFKSEVCFTAGVHPFRLIGALRRSEIERLVVESRRLMLANRNSGSRNTTGRLNPLERTWVYGRRGEPCHRCGTPILSRKQAPSGRVTFWCPNCQAAG